MKTENVVYFVGTLVAVAAAIAIAKYAIDKGRCTKIQAPFFSASINC